MIVLLVLREMVSSFHVHCQRRSDREAREHKEWEGPFLGKLSQLYRMDISDPRDGNLLATLQQHERSCCSDYAEERLYDVPPSTHPIEGIYENIGGKWSSVHVVLHFRLLYVQMPSRVFHFWKCIKFINSCMNCFVTSRIFRLRTIDVRNIKLSQWNAWGRVRRRRYHS